MRQRKNRWGDATETGRCPPVPASAATGAAVAAAPPFAATADSLSPLDHGLAAQRLTEEIEELEAEYRRAPPGTGEALSSRLHVLYKGRGDHARSMVPSTRPTSFESGSGATADPHPLAAKLAEAVAVRIGSGSDGAEAACCSQGGGALAGAGVGDAAGEFLLRHTSVR